MIKGGCGVLVVARRQPRAPICFHRPPLVLQLLRPPPCTPWWSIYQQGQSRNIFSSNQISALWIFGFARGHSDIVLAAVRARWFSYEPGIGDQSREKVRKEANYEMRLGKVDELNSAEKVFVYLTNLGYNPCEKRDCTWDSVTKLSHHPLRTPVCKYRMPFLDLVYRLRYQNSPYGDLNRHIHLCFRFFYNFWWRPPCRFAVLPVILSHHLKVHDSCHECPLVIG